VLSVELRNLWAKFIHAHRLRMGSSAIVRYFASQEFRVTPVFVQLAMGPVSAIHRIVIFSTVVKIVENYKNIYTKPSNYIVCPQLRSNTSWSQKDLIKLFILFKVLPQDVGSMFFRTYIIFERISNFNNFTCTLSFKKNPFSCVHTNTLRFQECLYSRCEFSLDSCE
jgi:hypothetical protein